MKTLITGALGCSGKRLNDFIRSNFPKETIVLTDIFTDQSKEVIKVDLTNYQAVISLLEAHQFQQIYHLAGTFTNQYDVDYQANVVTTKNIFDAVIELKLDAQILLIGSAAEYGMIGKEDLPITENHPLNPIGFYGLTKKNQTALMDLYVRRFNLNIKMARTFNLIDPSISKRLFIGNLYYQIQQFLDNKTEHIEVGNTKNKRDYF